MLGTVLTLPCVALAELAADPLDFVWIDLEHGALGARDVQPLAIAARAAGCAAIVRLGRSDYPPLAAVLDAGVDGVAAPHVESALEARRLVDRLRYPPRGSRGVAARRASGYDVPDTSAGGERGDPICMVQIESPDAVRAAAEIASVDGIDALVVGCADLAVALQGSVDVATRGMREAIGRVRDAAAAAGIVAGLAGPDDPALLRAVAGEGCSLFLCSADVRLYAQAVAERVSALRSELAAPESGRAGFGVRA